MTPYHYVMNNPMNYIDPFGLEEKKWWQIWKKKDDPKPIPETDPKPIPETDVNIEEVTVIANKPDNTNDSTTPWWAWSWGYTFTMKGANGSASSGNSQGVRDITDIMWLFDILAGQDPRFKVPGPMSSSDAEKKIVGEGAKGLGVMTPDSEIKPDKSDKSARTANVEKQEEYGEGKYSTWKKDNNGTINDTYRDKNGDSTLIINQRGDSTLYVPFSGGRAIVDLNEKK